MVITQNDVKNDINMLMQSMEDKDRPIVSPLHALKLAMLWPGICLVGYAIAVVMMLLNFTIPNDNSLFNTVDPLFHYIGGNLAFSALTLVFGLGIGVGWYGPALIYLSIPKEVKAKSILINSLKKTASRMGVFFITCNLILAVLAIFYRDALYVAPFLLVVTFLITQGVVSAELTRYGLPSAITKLGKLVRKI